MKRYLVSDWIADYLHHQGVRDIFYVSGGGAMFIIDSLGSHPHLNLVSNHHEQASAMCAEAHYRINRKPGVCLCTTGPAATNIITGVVCSWMDSIPTLFISGQAKSTSLIGQSNVRQRGVHEANICAMLQRSTKSSRLVSSVDQLIPSFVSAWEIMLSGRPGPVHLDIPLDIQSSPFEVFNSVHLDLVKSGLEDSICADSAKDDRILAAANAILHSLESTNLPIVLAGYGVFLSDTIEQMDSFCTANSIPVLSTKNLYGHLSSISSYHPGHVGTYGSRLANLMLQSADLLLVFGSRLAAPVTGYDLNLFAPNARVIVIDVDPNELDNMSIKAEKFCVSLDHFFPVLSNNTQTPFDFSSAWDNKIQCLKAIANNADYDIHSQKTDFINPYWFTERLIELSPNNAIFTYDQGAAYYCSTLSNNLKPGQLMFSNGGFTPMGYGLPAAIGSWYASDMSRPIICIHGDGGLQMNVQELQTVKHNSIPLKLFVYSNDGYLSIKNTQDAYFDGRYFGSDPSSGLSCPSFSAVANAYGITSYFVDSSCELIEMLPDILASDFPVLVELRTDPHQIIGPRVASRINNDGTMSSSALHDMSPFVDSTMLNRLFPSV